MKGEIMCTENGIKEARRRMLTIREENGGDDGEEYGKKRDLDIM